MINARKLRYSIGDEASSTFSSVIINMIRMFVVLTIVATSTSTNASRTSIGITTTEAFVVIPTITSSKRKLMKQQPKPQPHLESNIIHTSRTTSTGTKLYAIGTLVKKAKLNELQQYIQQNQPLPSRVMEYFQQIQDYQKQMQEQQVKYSPIPNQIGPLQQALTKRKGTLSVVAEYKRQSTPSKQSTEQSSTNSNGEFVTTTTSNIWDIDILSPIFREAGVTGMAVMADMKIGKCNYNDLQSVVNEQQRVRAANILPGPMYIINSDIIVDPLQIAQTAAIQSTTSTKSLTEHRKSEIAAIVLQYNIVVSSSSSDDNQDDVQLLIELLNAARAVQMEVIVTVTNELQAQNAIYAGASLLCIMAPTVSSALLPNALPNASTVRTSQKYTNNTFVDAQIACIDNIQYPEYNPKGNVCFLVHIPIKSDNTQWNEIEDVWYVRDTHLFQGIYVSDILYKGQIAASTTFTGSNDSVEHPGSIIKAMISKSSKLWGVVTTKSGRGEGAREYLGDILM
jgi:indole-3-glycerol phosphate synthase